LTREFAIVPAVDVLDGRAVRLRRGDFARVAVDAGEPLVLVRRAAAGSPPLVHVVALATARDGGAPVDLARAVVAAAEATPVQLGGGVRSVEDASALLDAGVERVVIGTAAFGKTPLRVFADALCDRLEVAIDVAGRTVRTGGWLTTTRITPEAALARCVDAGVGTVVCTAIDRDGMRNGPNLELFERVRARFDGEVLAAGGIRDRVDVEAVRRLGVDGVVVGRAWLEGTLEL
jgi:phosphoribosylformimino-5-aminoimidazole carboxamide ribotide isomerase